MANQEKPKDENPYTSPWPETKERFEVLLIKDGVAPHAAKPADFKRISVLSAGTLAALQSPEVAAEAGYRALTVVQPGMATQDEVLARQREIGMEQRPIDRARI